MKTLEAIEKDLRETREALSKVEGRDAEVYSRIVGYYRSVRNWNKGKKEEFGERKMFASPASVDHDAMGDSIVSGGTFCESCQLPADTDESPVSGSTACTEIAGGGASTEGSGASMGLFQDMAGSFGPAASPETGSNSRILLFVRPGCPSCPDAKAEAGKLVENFDVCMETVNADTEAGLAEARKLGVTATPTAILLRGNAEVSRAKDRDGIAKMGAFLEQAKKSA
jgi:ribonucleoside-triphosphate reductase